MARVQLCAAIPAAVLFATDGAATSGGGLKVKVPQAGQLASINTTVYLAATGGTTIAPAALLTNAAGELPGFVEPGSWTLTVNGTDYAVEAISGASVLTLESSSATQGTRLGVLEGTGDIAPAATGTDTTALNAAIAALSSGDVLTLRAGASYVINDALTVGVAGVTIRANGASIRQATWRKPVFDCGTTDDVKILGPGRLYSTETRTNGAGSFRGDDEDRYGAGVWSAGDRTIVRDFDVDGLDTAVHLTNWTTGSTHSGRPVGCIVDDIRCSNVDLGVLCVAQDRPRITNISGTCTASTSATDPIRLVYVTYYGSDFTRDLVASNWRGYDMASAPFQLKKVRGAVTNGFYARNCQGLLNYENVFDWTGSDLVSVDDQKATEQGSLFAIDDTSERVRLSNVIIRMAVSGRAVRFTGIDCVIDGLHVEVNRVAGVGAEDIQIDGTGTGINRLVHRNIGSSTTGFEGVIVAATAVGCFIRDPEIRKNASAAGTQACITILTGATGTMIEYDPALLVAAATFNKITDLGTSSRLIDKVP